MTRTLTSGLLAACLWMVSPAHAGSGQVNCDLHTDRRLREACLAERDALERAKSLGQRSWDEWVVLDRPLKQQILKALGKIVWDEASLKRVPSVRLLSPVYVQNGHEYLSFLLPGTAARTAVEANLFFFEGRRFDVWFARHREPAKPWLGAGLFVVDKTQRPRKAYLFSLLGEPTPKGRLPTVVPYQENCLMCHPNGLRLLRTADPAGTSVLSSAENTKRIAFFNEKILAYGKTDTVLALSHFLPELPDYAFEPLQHRACIDCHSDASPIRNPLRRMHMNEIFFTLTRETNVYGHVVTRESQSSRALMPLETGPISGDEFRCLVGWLTRKRLARCNERGEVERSPESAVSYVLDATASSLRAEAVSSFSSIPVDGFRLSGNLDCRDSVCSGEVRADLRVVTTGLALRDEHLRKRILNVADNPFALASVGLFPLGPKASPVKAVLTFAGKADRYEVSLHCTGKEALACELDGLRLDLTRHGIVPPTFLGAKVAPTVDVAGTLVFRMPSPLRKVTSLED